MTDTKLTKLPTIEHLIATMPPQDSDIESVDHRTWRVASSMLAMRTYIKRWPQWFNANRPLLIKELIPELKKETGKLYARNLNRHMPYFRKAIAIAHACDPAFEKPIMASYFAAKVEALASLTIYQKYFNDNNPDLHDKTRWIINEKIASIEKHEPAGIFLFMAMANAYEESFCFLFKMLGQFRTTYNRLPDSNEYDHLAKQLVVHLQEISFGSRKENAIFELYFDKKEPFFSFIETSGALRLDINRPDAEERPLILKYFDETITPEEREKQRLFDLPHHHGCPAATGYKGSESPVTFVAKSTFAAVRTALWPAENFNIQPHLPLEKELRKLARVSDSAAVNPSP